MINGNQNTTTTSPMCCTFPLLGTLKCISINVSSIKKVTVPHEALTNAA